MEKRTQAKIDTEPKVVLKDVDTFDVNDLEIGPTWHRLTDIVAVVFDLKSSTNLEKGRTAEGTASIYDAGIGGVVRTLNDFGADFVDIQGDGGFGLFWGPQAYVKAMCAAITIHTFSSKFEAQLEAKWDEVPATGFKVGLSSGPVMVKRVGLERHLDMQEPVWAGRPVNYAAKAAQQADPERIYVTGSIWDQISQNDYLAFSCGCRGGLAKEAPPALLWNPIRLDKIPDAQKFGLSLESNWCDLHGELFCNQILSGATRRTDIPLEARNARDSLTEGTDFQAAVAERRVEREQRFTELVGLRERAR
ncbi:hypothetical protein [Cryobacterium tepidiphilum]|uniref:Adenylate/guanylate cyclase domain-containing protein n=1 Tax=Cryobacterium tepidiphilum TaxID=2486026 RepID=A0A3M8LCH0_9MICO|nr:hypothetical protein [Cryobacterium tepidiphilum]RNE62188.1 hypothetical protein EEJ31_08875 [Cryobacterium tepidiphilum]